MKFLALIPLLLISSITFSQSITDLRDGNEYQYVQLGELYWLSSNLRYQTASTMAVPDSFPTLAVECGAFYLAEDIAEACPDDWRLPTEQELKTVIKANKRKRIDLNDTLNIVLCGRIDYEIYARPGEQSTFWIDSPLENGDIIHWHVFGKKHELHSHNVVVSKRQFPIRCVKEVE